MSKKITEQNNSNKLLFLGGDLNRTANVRFMAGDEKIVLKQEVVSSDAQGYMRMTTHINGNIPNIAAGAQVSVQDSKEEYRRSSPGGWIS